MSCLWQREWCLASTLLYWALAIQEKLPFINGRAGPEAEVWPPPDQWPLSWLAELWAQGQGGHRTEELDLTLKPLITGDTEGLTLLFFFFMAAQRGVRNLNPLTRDRTRAHGRESTEF